jgi:UDP-glucose 4-epimerase
MVDQVVNVGWGRAVSVRDVASEILRQCGRNDLALDHRPERPGDIQSLIADVRKSEALLKFRPSVTFPAGISLYLDWFGKTYSNPAALLEDNAYNWSLPK